MQKYTSVHFRCDRRTFRQYRDGRFMVLSFCFACMSCKVSLFYLIDKTDSADIFVEILLRFYEMLHFCELFVQFTTEMFLNENWFIEKELQITDYNLDS